MNHSTEWIVFALLRASAGLSIAALLVTAGVRLLSLRAPRSEQWAWFFVLAQGVLLVPVSITVPTSWLGSGKSPLPVPSPGPVPFARFQTAKHTNPASIGSHTDEGQASDRTPDALRQPELAPLGQNPPRPPRLSWSLAALMVWLAGIAVLLGVAFARYLRFARRLRLARPAAPEWRDEWRHLLDERSIRTVIPLLASREAGPALCRLPGGYRLVVPESLWAELAPSERLAILRHELAHYQRGDLWTTLLARCLALAQWFNPLAWWAASRFEAQCEFICDQASTSEDPAAFAEILIRLGSGGHARVAVEQAVRSGSLFERVHRLLTSSARPARWKCALPVAVAMSTLGLFTLRFQAVATSVPADETVSDLGGSPPVRSQLPARALLQIGTNNLRTRERIVDVALAPDGKLLAAAAAGNTGFPEITLFDVRTGSEVMVLSRRDRRGGDITRVAFSPDGSRLISGDISGNVTLWNWTDGRILFHERLHGGGGVVKNVIVDLAAYQGTVNDVAFSLDGGMFATAGLDGAVRLRRVENPKDIVRDFKTPWSPTGRPNLIMVGGGPSPGPQPGLESAGCVAFTPDGTRLVVGSGNTISVWRITDGQLLRRIERVHGNREGASDLSVASLAVTPDGRKLISAGHSTVPVKQTSFKHLKNAIAVTLSEVRIWNLETGERVMDLDGQDRQGLGYAALSRSGRRLAVADFGVLRLVDAGSGKLEQTMSWPDSGGVRPVFSPDETVVATATGTTVALFDVRAGRRIGHVESAPASEPESSAWSPSGDRVVTGHRDGLVRVWEAKTGELLWSKPLSRDLTPLGQVVEPNFVTFSRDGRRVIAAGGRDMDTGLVAIYEASRGLLVRTVSLPEVTHAALSPDREVLVVAASCREVRAFDVTRLYAIDVETGRILWAMPTEGGKGAFFQLRAIQFRPDSRSLDVAQCNGNVIHFDALTGKELHRFKADWRPLEQQKADRPLTTAQLLWQGAFSPDNRTLVSSAHELVYVWDVDAGKLRRKIQRIHKRGSYLAIAPDGKTLATADHLSADDYGSDAIRLYDLDTGEPVLTLEPNNNRAVVMTFSSDGSKLFTAFRRGSAIVWDVRRSERASDTKK
jgi:WD40 repeat protein/beta-lactamase regulating signal transducer with metallopeptidase domain